MKKTVFTLLPMTIVLVAVAIGYYVVANKPVIEKKQPPPVVSAVKVIPIESQHYPVRITTQGTITARTETTLVSQVAGEITHVSPRFRSGSFFKQGELLLQIDPRDYEVAVTLADSNLAQARLKLSQEQARAKQARRDWERLGESGEPGELVLRKPQLKSEQANIAAARAQLTQARINLERTKITAPYEGYLQEKNVDIGQFVNPGNSLGKIFAVDYAEVRLPLNSSQLSLIKIPEVYREQASIPVEQASDVTLSVKVGNKTWRWPARMVRSDGAIDTRSRQTYVIAKVDEPYRKRADGQPALKIGQFVKAEIQGVTLDNVFVIPEPALRAGNSVFLVDANNKLLRREINVIWREADKIIVDTGLSTGDRLVTTPVGLNLAGTQVSISNNKQTAIQEH